MRLTSTALKLLSILLLSSSIIAKADQLIRYPQAGTKFTKHHQYPIELLKLALSYAPDTIHLKPSDYFMTQGRAIKQLISEKDIDVMWTMTSTEREADIKPIRIPIYKGLIGWRLFLSTEEWLSENAENGFGIEELKQKNIIQGHDWPDTEILAYNRFSVQSGPSYEGLFHILSLNRAELFPRSTIEIWDELESYKSSNIRLEQHTLISYPTASYFFVSPKNEALASIIESGLKKAHKDGQFDQLFNHYYQEIIHKSNLRSRQHFRLINPLLPAKTPLNIKSYWFHLDKD